MAEQVSRLATANTSTTCCCEHVRNTAAANITHMNNPHITYMNHLVADLYRWSWGRWRVSEARCETATTSTGHIFNVEQRAHWLPIQERTNQLCHVMMSLGQIELDLSECAV